MVQQAMERNTRHNGDALSADQRSDGFCLTVRTVSGSASLGRSISAFTNESNRDSIGMISRRGSRRRGSYSLPRDLGDRILESFSLSRELANQILGEVDASLLAQVGDRGDRRIVDVQEDNNEIENLEIPTDNLNSIERSFKDAELVIDGIPSETSGAKMASPAYLLEEDSLFRHTVDLMLNSPQKDKVPGTAVKSQKDSQYRLPPKLDYISYLIHLAVFGILGVLSRYMLEKLFGPDLLALTGDDSPLYLDLPSNMLGSFLMGWFGIVFKADLRYISDHLVIGITTGFLGSLTTFSGWNQKMLNLSAKGHWTFAMAGIFLGMFIVNECVNIGVESAEWLRRCFLQWIEKCPPRIKSKLKKLHLDTFKRHMIVMILMLVFWVSLWSLSGVLARKKLDNLTNGAVLWLGCLVGPFGVWTRWYLARLNGLGLGNKGSLKWLPLGTLLANFLAACLMAALTTISKALSPSSDCS